MSVSEKYTVGVSAKLLRADGTLSITEVDLSSLLENEQIDVRRLADVDTGDLLYEHVAELDAAILFLERVSEKTFAEDNRLKLFARYGVGYDTLDIAACTAANVAVAIAPSGVRRPVATTVVGLLLALTLNLMTKNRIARDIPVGWEEKTRHNGIGLVGRTLGCVGMGNIGAEVFRLMAPFDMQLIAHDDFCDKQVAAGLGVELVGLDELFQRSDVVSLHCPLTPETHHLVDARRLALMKPEAYLINTARGPVVDELALIDALRNGVIAGAGLDVFEQEPPTADNPLLAMDNVILAPHALCFTDQCMGGLGEADVKACMAMMVGKSPDTVVNAEILKSAAFQRALANNKAKFQSR